MTKNRYCDTATPDPSIRSFSYLSALMLSDVDERGVFSKHTSSLSRATETANAPVTRSHPAFPPSPPGSSRTANRLGLRSRGRRAEGTTV